MAIPDIQYLRWVRNPQLLRDVRVPLILSGMEAPPAEIFADLDVADLMATDPRDHPQMAETIADTWGIPPDAVLVQPGSHWNIFLALAARLEMQSGPIIVEQPAYEPLRRIPAALGAEVLRLPRRPERNYALDLAALGELGAEKPTALVLSHPHNPTGVTLTAREIAALSEWSRRTGCAVLSDEVYLEFLPQPDASSLLKAVSGSAIIRSFTKVMGLGAIRCSVLAGDREWMARVARITDYGPVIAPAPTQALAAIAWQQRERLWERARRAAANGREIVGAWADRNAEFIELRAPEHGIVCFPRVSPAHNQQLLAAARRHGIEGPLGFGLDDPPFGSPHWLEALRRREGILLTPGSFFEDPLGFRVGYGGDPELLQRGLEGLERFLRSELGRVAAS